MQTQRIPYSTATWGIVEDASQPAPFLSVVANRQTKMDAYFCFVRATKFIKKHTKIKIIEYYIVQYSDMGQRASRSGGGWLRAKRNGKWI